MEFIDKTNNSNKTKAENVIRNFIDDLQKEGNPLPKDLYTAFKGLDPSGKRYTESLIPILMEEQHNRCCYCMRMLTEDPIILEHIIPNNTRKKAEFDTYVNYSVILKENVCFAPDYIAEDGKNYISFPHTVAYQNLSVSCNGRFFNQSGKSMCCNNFRGNKFVIPFILDPDIHESFHYHTNGRVTWSEDPIKANTIRDLGLNDQTLVMIRFIWKIAKSRNVLLPKLKKAERSNFLYSIMNELRNEDFDMLFNFMNDSYWSLLMKYNYFG